MRRFLALLLVLCAVIPMFAACKRDGAVSLTLFEGGSAVLVYDTKLLTATEVKKFVSDLESYTGARITVKMEYGGEGAKILLGNVNSDSCRAVTKTLRMNDYALKISEGDYVIGAVETKPLKAAMQYFLDTVLVGFEKGALKLSASQDYVYNAEYRSEGFLIGGATLGETQIVIPNDPSASEYRTAVALQQHLMSLTGFLLPIKEGVATKDARGKIVIGKGLCQKATVTEPHGYALAVSGTTLEVNASSLYGYEAVQRVLREKVFAAKAEKELGDALSLSGKGTVSGAVTDPLGDVRIMFNNIHGSCDINEFPVKPVAQMMSEVYKAYLPDVLGLQECSPNMRTGGNIAGYLAPEYKEVQTGSAVNFTPLFYREETVELLKSGFFCFDQMPVGDSVYDAMRGSYTAYQLWNDNDRQNTDGLKGTRKDNSKGATWAIFRVKSTGNIFMAASTHLWWESNDDGDCTLRRIQLAYLKDMLLYEAKTFADAELAGAELPIFVGGDYNARQNGKTASDLAVMGQSSVTLMSGEGVDTKFINTNLRAPTDASITLSTHHAYAKWNATLGIYENEVTPVTDYEHSLDYIFMSKETAELCEIRRSAISTEKYSMLSSDHCPILIDVAFKTTAPKK